MTCKYFILLSNTICNVLKSRENHSTRKKKQGLNWVSYTRILRVLYKQQFTMVIIIIVPLQRINNTRPPFSEYVPTRSPRGRCNNFRHLSRFVFTLFFSSPRFAPRIPSAHNIGRKITRNTVIACGVVHHILYKSFRGKDSW